MKTLDPVWSPYRPDDAQPWDLRRVAHLHRRAGFAATWAELQRDLEDGPDKSIDRLLAGKASLHAPPEFDSTATLLADAVRRGLDTRIGLEDTQRGPGGEPVTGNEALVSAARALGAGAV